jgi:hypothetical protein
MEWSPKNDAELVAGWRLWLELSTQVWPDATWDGTPADAVCRLRVLLRVCDEIQTEYIAESPEKSAEIVRLLQSMFLAATTLVALWWDDDWDSLDDERAALLRADLACFADHADGVRTLLAVGGGWSAMNGAFLA